MVNLSDLTTAQLLRAVAIKVEIKNLEQELESLTQGKTLKPQTATRTKKAILKAPGRMTPELRAKMAAAAKARWARIKAAANA